MSHVLKSLPACLVLLALLHGAYPVSAQAQSRPTLRPDSPSSVDAHLGNTHQELHPFVKRYGWTRAADQFRCNEDGIRVDQSDQSHKFHCRDYGIHRVLYRGPAYKIYEKRNGVLSQVVQFDNTTVLYDKTGTVPAGWVGGTPVGTQPATVGPGKPTQSSQKTTVEDAAQKAIGDIFKSKK